MPWAENRQAAAESGAAVLDSLGDCDIVKITIDYAKAVNGKSNHPRGQIKRVG
jgi:hypothetical protein